MEEVVRAPTIPELVVTDYVESARFNVNVLGRVQLMLEQLDDDV